jgi:hypothetical protein
LLADERLCRRNGNRLSYYLPNEAVTLQRRWGDYRNCPTAFGGPYTRDQCNRFFDFRDNEPKLCKEAALEAQNECLSSLSKAMPGLLTCTLICMGAGVIGGLLGGGVCSLACGTVSFIIGAAACKDVYSAVISSCIERYVQCLWSGGPPSRY